jgi:hypothetical protein
VEGLAATGFSTALSTLRRHVKALGGELEVIAKFEDKSVRLTGV